MNRSDPAAMTRKPRPTAAGFYHVAARASVDERLFRDEHDFLRFVAELERATVRERGKCVAFCLLNVHYHLLLETEDGALPLLMQRLNLAYARAYNARYGRRGHAFADRYLAVPKTDDAALLAAFRYIAQNPVEAGLCDQPYEWPWSSYASTVGLTDEFAFVDAAIVVGLCGDEAGVRLFVEAPTAVSDTAGAVSDTKSDLYPPGTAVIGANSGVRHRWRGV